MSNLKLKAKIIERFGTQCKFAEAAGIHEVRVSGFVHGRSRPTEEEKAIIAAKLGVKVQKLFPAETKASQE